MSRRASFNMQKNVVRFYEGALWSTHFFAAGASLAKSDNDLFTTSRGSQGQGHPTAMSIAETNMREAGRVANGLAFTVRQIALEPYHDTNTSLNVAEMRNLHANCVVIWSFLSTEIEVAPMSLIGQGGGIYGATADTGATDGSRSFLNSGAGQTWVYGELPVILDAGTTFSLRLKFGNNAAAVAAGQNLLIRAHLIGVITSAVTEA